MLCKLDEYESSADIRVAIANYGDAEDVAELHEEQFDLVLADSRMHVRYKERISRSISVLGFIRDEWLAEGDVKGLALDFAVSKDLHRSLTLIARRKANDSHSSMKRLSTSVMFFANISNHNAIAFDVQIEQRL